jgi:sigma-B regulation protein RsbU (phosphoserine phosphatase)
MSQVISEAMKRHEGAATRGGQTDMTAWAQALQERINQAVAQMPTREEVAKFQETARAAERSAASRREEARAARMQTITTLKGDALRTDVQENGRPIGRINARLNSDRLFRTVLGMTHRDQREIPFAVDADGRLHSPRSSDRAVVQSLNLAGSMPAEGISVRAVKDWVVATRKDPSGVTFGIARPMGDDLRDLRRVTARNFGLGFAFIALVFAGSVPLARGMTRNLGTLMDGVQRLSRGDLGARVSVRSRDEFGRLGAAFNQMAENLSAHEKLMVEQERIRRELEVCRQIQNEMLPHQPLRLGLAEVMGVSIPAREVGGDFFNYFALPDGEIALLVGDVSGKGVAAALLMANVQATLRARLPLEQDLARLADMLDRDLEQNTPPEVYLTLFVGILDPHRRQLRYVSAGHNTQFLLHARGGLERLASTGRPLGLLAGNGYEERTVTLDAGDSLFFYTDGMVEVENEAGDIMGSDRLEQLLTESPSTEIDALLARIAEAIRAFRGKAEPRDDATMMALRFGGTA